MKRPCFTTIFVVFHSLYHHHNNPIPTPFITALFTLIVHLVWSPNSLYSTTCTPTIISLFLHPLSPPYSHYCYNLHHHYINSLFLHPVLPLYLSYSHMLYYHHIYRIHLTCTTTKFILHLIPKIHKVIFSINPMSHRV